jgi:isopenicillin N synthase-like dioxygenase
LHNGFFQIVGHRVPAQVQNEVLESLKAFFSLPQEEKEKVHKGKPPQSFVYHDPQTDGTLDNTTWNRGYENLGSQILEAGANPDQKEGYYVGEEITKDHPYFVGKKLNSGPNQWPEGFPRADLFRKSSMEYYNHMHALARDVLSVVAQTLYLDSNYFGDFTEGAVATLRYLHYPPQPKDSDEKLSRGIGAHTDFGSVTLLMQDEVDGLQVWEKTTEEWLDVSCAVSLESDLVANVLQVAPIKGAYVVNLGNMFMRWSVQHEEMNLVNEKLTHPGPTIVTSATSTESLTSQAKRGTLYHSSTAETQTTKSTVSPIAARKARQPSTHPSL